MVLYGMGSYPVDAVGHPLSDYVKDRISKRAKEMQADGSLAKKLARSKGRKEINTVEDYDEYVQGDEVEANVCSMQHALDDFVF